MKRVAVIGAGGMGHFHAQTLLDLPGVELVAVADPYPSDAVQALGVPVLTDTLECARQGYDGVIIASPDNTHSELTLAALDAGSRVLCEKPLSDDLAGAQAIIDVEVAEGLRRVQVGFMREYDAAHTGLAEVLATFGPLHYIRCTHRNTNADVRSAEVVLVQSIVHDIHTVRWLAGEVTAVEAHTIARPGGLDHVLLVLRLVSGASATVEFSDNTYAYEVEVEATAQAGMVTTSAPQRPRLRIDGDYRTPIGDDWFGWFADAYRTQDSAWIASLDAPAAVGPSAWDGIAAQRVAEAAITSMTQGGAAPVEVIQTPELYRP